MYSIEDIKRGLSNPRLAAYELNRFYYRRGYTQECNEHGVDIFEEEWDSLVILDACRFDLFKRHNTLSGALSWRRSRGSNTAEFLRGNVLNRDLLDTVYVTANPQFYRHRDELDATFHSVINVWQEDGWHDELGTVLPKTTTEYAIRVAEQYPNKRLLIHYIQPHYPFIDTDSTYDKGQLADSSDSMSFWRKLRMNRLDVSPDRIWEEYARNFELVLPHVRELLSSLDGRTVITSDHGNMFGERCTPVPIRGWGHPHGIYTPQLVKVPWLVSETGPRRKIVEDPVDEHKVVNEQVVKDRLQQLGYTE